MKYLLSVPILLVNYEWKGYKLFFINRIKTSLANALVKILPTFVAHRSFTIICYFVHFPKRKRFTVTIVVTVRVEVRTRKHFTHTILFTGYNNCFILIFICHLLSLLPMRNKNHIYTIENNILKNAIFKTYNGILYGNKFQFSRLFLGI